MYQDHFKVISCFLPILDYQTFANFLHTISCLTMIVCFWGCHVPTYTPTCIYKKVIAHLMKGKFSHKVIVFYDNCMWTLLFVHRDPWASVKLSTDYRLRDVDDATSNSGWDFARHLTVTKSTIVQKRVRNADCILENNLAKNVIIQ